jgi:hypothetical protein
MWRSFIVFAAATAAVGMTRADTRSIVAERVTKLTRAYFMPEDDTSTLYIYDVEANDGR